MVAPPNAELRIPYGVVFDAAPPAAAGLADIVITNAELRVLVSFIFQLLQ